MIACKMGDNTLHYNQRLINTTAVLRLVLLSSACVAPSFQFNFTKNNAEL